jgi:serine/threonine-protein kinase
MGSPLYMPPEQMAASRDVDARADIWALGAILYELLAARSPFAGETLPEVCMRIATELPPPLSTFRPDVPPALEAVILRCLEKDRERRYPNVAELAVALGGFAPARARVSVDRVLRTIQAAGLSSSAPSVPPSADAFGLAPAVTAGTGTEAQWGRTTRGPGSKWGRVLAGSVAGVAVLGALAFVARGLSSTEAEAGAPAPKPGAGAAVAASPAPAADAPTVTADRAASPVAALPSVVPLPSSVAPAVSAELTPAPKRSNMRRSPTSNKSAQSNAAATATPHATPQPARKSNVFDER